MKKISTFTPHNDVNSLESKRAYDQIMKDKDCHNVFCRTCCFKNKSYTAEFKHCLPNLIALKDKDRFIYALKYYKKFHMTKIVQEKLDI